MENTILCPKCGHGIDVDKLLFQKIEEQVKAENREKVIAYTQKQIEKARAEEIAKAKNESTLQAAELEKMRLLLQDTEKQKNALIDQVKKDMEALFQERQKLHNETHESRMRLLQEEINKAKEAESQLKQSFDERLKLKEEALNAEMNIVKAREKEMGSKIEALQRDFDERLRKSNAEKEQEMGVLIQEQKLQIEKMTQQINSLKETSDKRSQQLQGEAFELYLEKTLYKNPLFLTDEITEVSKGVNGADILVFVRNKKGEQCGQIIIEAKRAANFSRNWIEKIKQDRLREHNAPEAVNVIVSSVLRDPDAYFEDYGDNTYGVASDFFSSAMMLIRAEVEKIHAVFKNMNQSDDAKSALYNYLSSDDFKMRVDNFKKELATIEQNNLKILKIATSSNTSIANLKGFFSSDIVGTIEAYTNNLLEYDEMAAYISPKEAEALIYDASVSLGKPQKVVSSARKATPSGVNRLIFDKVFEPTGDEGIYRNTQSGKLFIAEFNGNHEVLVTRIGD